MTSETSFNISTDKLCALLDALKPSISGRMTLPILSHVLLATEGDSLKATGTNLDIWIESSDEAVIEKPGSFCVPFLRLLNAAKQFDGASAKFVAAKGAVEITSGASRMKLPTCAAEEYPATPKGDEGHAAEIPKLSAIFRRALPFASNDSSRYVICSVFLTKGVAVATDGNQLISQAIEYDGPDCIVPTGAAQAVAQWEAESVTATVRNDMVSFRNGNLHLHSKVIENKYPNWKNVVPGDQKHNASFDRQSLHDAVRYCTTMGDDDKVCRVKIGPGGTGQATVFRAGNESAGEMARTLSVKAWPKFTIAFDGARLSSVLRAFDNDEITIGLTDEMSPLVVRQEERTAVLMPMRVA